jgi:hypothetical protein
MIFRGIRRPWLRLRRIIRGVRIVSSGFYHVYHRDILFVQEL